MDKLRLSAVKALRDAKNQLKQNYSLEDSEQDLYAEGLKEQDKLDKADEKEESGRFSDLKRKLAGKRGY